MMHDLPKRNQKPAKGGSKDDIELTTYLCRALKNLIFHYQTMFLEHNLGFDEILNLRGFFN